MDDRPQDRQLEPARAVADEHVPLDHHVEEVLAALSELAEVRRFHPSRSERLR